MTDAQRGCMTLTWTGVPTRLEAVGCRATYTINRLGPLTRYHLQATGHDTLPLLDPPPYGAQFIELWDAQRVAGEVDRRPNHDPQMSGA